MKKKLTHTTKFLNSEGPRHHFFVTSVSEWRTGYDLAAMLTYFKREGHPFAVYLVPGPETASYKIEMFVPQVEGTVHLLTYIDQKG